VIEDSATFEGNTLSCRAEARPYPHGRAVVIDVFNSGASHIASLRVLCSSRCSQFETIAKVSDNDLERRVLCDFLKGRLSLDLGRAINSSQQLRVAGRVNYPGQVIVELH
jgi:hypothetical protein